MPPHPDLVIAEIAERQHGVVSRAQLLAAGVSDRVIANRLARKILRQVFRGAYKVGPCPPSQSGLFLAAVFAVGRRAVLSHRSAAAHWNLRPQRTGLVDVTVPRQGTRPRDGIRLHVTRTLHPNQLTVHERIPCTTPARTVVDCATTLPRGDVKRLIERAENERIFNLPDFEAAAGRPGHRGARVVRALLADLTDAVPPTRSEFEDRFLSLVDSASLPRPRVNGRVCGHEVDFHWPHAKLIVETDGAETHDTDTAFHRDRNRDLDLELAGWHVIRITWRQLRDEPQRIVALLRAKLGCL